MVELKKENLYKAVIILDIVKDVLEHRGENADCVEKIDLALKLLDAEPVISSIVEEDIDWAKDFIKDNL